MTLRRAFLWTWISGFVLFGLVISLSLPLVLTDVPGGIVDHQAAGTAAEVDRIQTAWRLAGLWNWAAIAMIGDLVFIGVYGVGCLLGGLTFRRSLSGFGRVLGTAALVGGAIFLVTDYIETIAQIIQLWRFSGNDTLASLAASVRPTKTLSWIVATSSVLAALAMEGRAHRT